MGNGKPMIRKPINTAKVIGSNVTKTLATGEAAVAVAVALEGSDMNVSKREHLLDI